MTKAEQALIEANAIMSQFVPLFGVVSVTARAVIALLRKSGNEKEARSFEVELAAAETERQKLGAALEEFRRKYPVEEPPT